MSPEATDVYNFKSLDSSQDQCHLKLLLCKIIRLWIADKMKCYPGIANVCNCKILNTRRDQCRLKSQCS